MQQKKYDEELLLESSLDTFIAYSFLDKLTKPFEDMKAFKLGVIDEKGNVLIPKGKRTQEQKSSFTTFDRLVLNLRKIITKYVPFGTTRLSSYATALFLLKEERKYTTEDFNIIQGIIVKYIDKRFDNEILNEELGELLTQRTEKHPIEIGKEYELLEDIITSEDNIPVGDHIIFQDDNPVDEILGLNIYKGIHVESKTDMFVTRKVVALS